jgi:cytoskeletal protein CcmA (bactofilin family)
MASTYTDIGTELMATGENAGNWGTKTNTNIQIIEEAIRGYVAQSIAGSAQTTALTYSDGSTGDSARNAVIALTGTITGNQVVTVTAKEKWWIIDNQTSGAYTVQFMVSGQTGVTWGTSDKGTKILYCNGTDVIDTGITSAGAFDLDGDELILDADADTSITASTDDQIDFRIAGADDFTMTANAFNVLTGSHATFADSANAKFGTGNDMLLYHDGSNSYITNAVGALKVATETSGIAITLGHTTSEVTVADNLTVTGTLTGTLATAAQGTVTSLGTLTTLTVDNVITNGTTIGHTDDTDLMTLADGVLTVAGELDATTLDISGNADIDGTTNLDAVDIDGAVQVDATITVGADDQGYDVKFFGDTASAYMLWDTSADDLVLAGAAGIDLAGDIDVDGTANLDAVDIDGAVQIDNTVTVGVNDTGYDVKFFGATSGAYMLWDESTDDLVLAGAAGIDLAGDIDVDGTANLDAVDIDGAVQIDGTLTTGVDDTGVDVKFFGATSGAYMLWDESTDDLILAGAAKLYLYDAAGGEHISSDGTDLTIASGAALNLTATTDVVIPANVGVTFGSGEKIEGDSTDLTITSGAKINLTATSDVVIPANVGITFGTGEKIEGDSTDLTVTSGGAINLTATTDVVIPNSVGIQFGGASEKIEGDGTDLTISANNLTVDAAADIILDAAGNNVIFKSGGTAILDISNSSSDAVITSSVQDKDIIFKGDDGGSAVTALTLDMSAGGIATFGAAANVAQQAITSSSNAVAWDASDKPNAYHLTTENTTFSAPTNAVEGAFICLELNFDGSHTIGWNTIFEFAASTEPTETATNAKTDIHVFRYNGAVWQEVGRTMNLSES